MNPNQKKIVAGILVFSLIAIAAGVILASGSDTGEVDATAAQTAPTEDPGADRDPAPAISGPDVADPGKTVALEDFRGKPVVVQVWASWCPICNEEAPDIAAFQKANPDVVFIGVNVEDTQSEALAYKKRHGLTHEYDISDPDRETEGELGFTGQPNSMVIDKDGRVVEVFPGAVSKEQLEDALGQI